MLVIEHVILGRLEEASPESRDSGLGAMHRPGMTVPANPARLRSHAVLAAPLPIAACAAARRAIGTR
jgi:hypothetical protein